MLERALDYEITHYGDYKSAMSQSVLDRLLGGRGTSWVRYEPHIAGEAGGMAEGMPEDGLQVTEDTDEAETEGGIYREDQERIEYECAPVDYVYWRDFGHTIARTWEEVTAVWRKVYMERPALVEPATIPPKVTTRGPHHGVAAMAPVRPRDESRVSDTRSSVAPLSSSMRSPPLA